MSAYLITRDGEELGSFDISQIQDALRSGELQSTDWAWRDGMPDWKPLSSVVATPSAGPAPAQPAVEPVKRTVVAPLSSQPVSVPKPTAISSPPSVGAKSGAVNPYASPSTPIASSAFPAPAGGVPPAIVWELAGTKPWVRLISVLMWIGCIGLLLAIIGNVTMVGVTLGAVANKENATAGFVGLVAMMTFGGLTALLVLYPTVKLTKYASNISRLAQTKSFTDLAGALREQRRFWKFYGIMTLIYLFLVLGMALLVLAGVGVGFLSKQG